MYTLGCQWQVFSSSHDSHGFGIPPFLNKEKQPSYWEGFRFPRPIPNELYFTPVFGISVNLFRSLPRTSQIWTTRWAPTIVIKWSSTPINGRKYMVNWGYFTKKGAPCVTPFQNDRLGAHLGGPFWVKWLNHLSTFSTFACKAYPGRRVGKAFGSTLWPLLVGFWGLKKNLRDFLFECIKKTKHVGFLCMFI